MIARRAGFTLLEMLIALGVFAVIGVMSSQILAGILDLSGTVRERSDQLAELQRAVFVVGRDIEQLAHRGVRDGFGDRTPVLTVGKPLIEFTRRGWQNPLRSPRSELQRVAYDVSESDLVRAYWPVLDRGPDTEPVRQVLLKGIRDVEFVAHAEGGDTFRYWPPAPGAAGEEAVLAAIELRLDHLVYGRLGRLWAVPSPTEYLGETTSDPDRDDVDDDAPDRGEDDAGTDLEIEA